MAGESVGGQIMGRRLAIVGMLLASTVPACVSPLQGSREADGPWKRANLTHFESYPEPGSEECIRYSGCKWMGLFAFRPGKQSEAWVMRNNIAAVHAKDAETYGLKTLRLRQDGRTIDVKVYDLCSDDDCDGCCTRNSRETGFLIDIEKYTMQRFGSGSGIVEWKCLDCD